MSALSTNDLPRRLGLAIFACLGLGCFQEPPGNRCGTDISCAESAGTTTGREPDSDGADPTTSGSSEADDDTRSSESMGSAGSEETSGTAADTDSSETSGTGGSTSGSGDSGTEETGETTSGDGGAAYGDPARGCLPDEEPVPFPGVEGDLCSASCVTTADCPPLEPPASAFPQCALALNGSRVATNCILACDFTANPSQCPVGSSCKDVGQGGVVGTCTYP